MDVLVCVKRTPAVGAHILLTGDGLGIDTRHLGFTMGPHEECAVEEAVRLAENARTAGDPGSVTVLTVGPPEAAEQLRYAISMGADDGVRVEADSEELAPEPTAASIVRAVRTLAGEGRRFGLILFGTESAVAGHGQAAVRAGYALGLPVVTGIKGISVHGNRTRLRREAETGIEVYDVPLPAAVAVKEGINLPRYPTVRGRMRARKADIRTLPGGDEPSGLRTVRLRTPCEEHRETVVLGTGAAAAPAVADLLADLGVV